MLIRVLAAGILAAVSAFCQATAAMSGTAAARFLEQATWGPTQGSVAELERVGINQWLKAQFALNTSDIPDQPLVASDGKPNRDLAPVQEAFFANAVNGRDQLRQRVAFALSQIWVVSAESGVNVAYAYPPYWRIFRDNAFGNYRDVIKAVTLNPAMGRYLNMANNNKADAATGTAANENYARELMQLFTLGLNQLNMDGTPVVDGNGAPVATYDQTVVTNMAKVFTGWTYPTAPGKKARENNPPYYLGRMFAVEAEHDTSAKTIFGGNTIPAGQTAEQDLDMVIEDLMKQPTMAPFVSQQLIEHLVTSNPSPGYVQRVASVFRDNGSGVTGDLKAVVEAILTDEEARAGDEASAAVDPVFGHLREPVLFLAGVLRGLNATLGSASRIDVYANQMGEDLFRAPSVFSYFSPQYRTSGGLLGPEFQIYSTATAAARADVVNRMLYGHLDGSTKVDLTPFVEQAQQAGALAQAINTSFLHGAMSAGLEQAVETAAEAAGTPLAKAQAGLYVALTSSEYQVIH